MKNYETYIDINPEVKNALDKGLPVVALESTIIAHGMPYPQNVETALLVEETIRKGGAIPATIGMLNGVFKIGMTREEIEYFAQAEDVLKLSRRDLPYAVSQKKHGATTVAGTMIAAAMAGIKVFVTGGIGGVHRNAETTFDISADLVELANTDVTVICAGVKSILNIGATLEYLETQGVPVLAYKTKEFPAFYSRKSGFSADYDMDSPKAIAAFIHAKTDLNLKGGTVIGCPIPSAHEIPYEEMEGYIVEALDLARKNNIVGKETTPFLLDKIKSLTEGRSLEANIQLVVNNAVLGAEIAKEYSLIKK